VNGRGRLRCAPVLSALVLLSAALSACGASRASEPLADWLSVDASSKTVTLRLHAAYNGVYSGFNFNGYGKGEVLVDVPRRWRVTVRCVNDSSSRDHSCAIVSGPGATTPAFPGAQTQPLPPHGKASFSFRPSHPGSYRIVCLLPGDTEAGMWDVLDVTLRARPTVVPLRRPPT
jgi:Sulfocyanin (SoxE) domain